MSTTVRRGDGAGKEKKGTSPSTSSTTTKKTTRPSTSSISPSHGQNKTVSSSTTKQGPTHPKPTKAKPNEPSRLSKRPITEPSNPKSPAPPRQRSIDQPHPPSHAQKAIRVAKNTNTQSASPSRPSLSSRPVRKEVRSMSTSPSLKKNALSRGPSKGTSLIKKATKSSMSESNLNLHGSNSDVDDDDVKSLPEISEMPVIGSDLGDPATLDDVVINEEEDHGSLNIEKVDESEEDVSVADNHIAEDSTAEDTTVSDDETVEEATNTEEQMEGGEQNQGEVDQEVAKDETNETLSEEEKLDAVTPKEEEKEEEEKMDKEVEMKIETNDKINDENINVDSGRKSPVANVVITRSQSMGGKDNQQDYNDVIEQTATKLRSNKRNKVLALAGAFETVISLQDSSKK